MLWPSRPNSSTVRVRECRLGYVRIERLVLRVSYQRFQNTYHSIVVLWYCTFHRMTSGHVLVNFSEVFNGCLKSNLQASPKKHAKIRIFQKSLSEIILFVEV